MNAPATPNAYDVQAVRRDFPILCANHLRQAADLSRQRRLGAKAAGRHRRGDARLRARIRQRASRPALPVQRRDRGLRGRRARPCDGFINAAHTDEIIFTRNATEAINLAAASFGGAAIGEGDEIVLSIMEHHSNIVPWNFLRERGAR